MAWSGGQALKVGAIGGHDHQPGFGCPGAAAAQKSNVINSGSDMNHLKLTCAGSTIAGSINRQPVFSLQDATYSQGTFKIGASGPPSGAGEIRFASFAVLQA